MINGEQRNHNNSLSSDDENFNVSQSVPVLMKKYEKIVYVTVFFARMRCPVTSFHPSRNTSSSSSYYSKSSYSSRFLTSRRTWIRIVCMQSRCTSNKRCSCKPNTTHMVLREESLPSVTLPVKISSKRASSKRRWPRSTLWRHLMPSRTACWRPCIHQAPSM